MEIRAVIESERRNREAAIENERRDRLLENERRVRKDLEQKMEVMEMQAAHALESEKRDRILDAALEKKEAKWEARFGQIEQQQRHCSQPVVTSPPLRRCLFHVAHHVRWCCQHAPSPPVPAGPPILVRLWTLNV
jgi:hypothetical protein